MRPIDAEPLEGGVKLHSSIHGDGAYEAFKRIASEFYTDYTYKFVALTLDGEPRPDVVTFTAEFWRTPDGAEAPPPNDPLTLEQLREMDGGPVWAELLPPTAGSKAGWALAYTNHGCSAAQQRWTNWTLWYDEYGKTWLAYRRKPEEGAT